MKSTLLALTVFATFVTTPITYSQSGNDKKDPPGEAKNTPRLIRVQAEFIEMPHSTYTMLMAEPRTSTDDSDLRAACAKLVATGEAEVIETLSVTAVPGQNVRSESISEFVYPAEQEPSSFPMKSRETPGGSPPPPTTRFSGAPNVPAAYDTRNLGSTFEVEAQIDAPSESVTLRFTPTIVHHVGSRVWGVWERNGAKIETSTPRFYTLALRTGVSVVPGCPHMIAALSPRDQDGWTDPSRKVMTFIRADMITVSN